MRTILMTLALASASPVSWAGLLTTQVEGTLVFTGRLENFFSSSRGFVPAGCANSGLGSTTVTVSAIAELCFQSDSNRIVADFTDTSLFFTDDQTLSRGVTGFVATFTFAPGLVTGVSEVSDDYPPGMGFSFANNILTLTYPGNSPGVTDASFLARYNFTFPGDNGVPEPSTTLLVSAGLAGAALLRRLGR